MFLVVFCQVVTEICGQTGTCFQMCALLVWTINQCLTLLLSLNAEWNAVSVGETWTARPNWNAFCSLFLLILFCLSNSCCPFPCISTCHILSVSQIYFSYPIICLGIKPHYRAQCRVLINVSWIHPTEAGVYHVRRCKGATSFWRLHPHCVMVVQVEINWMQCRSSLAACTAGTLVSGTIMSAIQSNFPPLESGLTFYWFDLIIDVYQQEVNVSLRINSRHSFKHLWGIFRSCFRAQWWALVGLQQFDWVLFWERKSPPNTS